MSLTKCKVCKNPVSTTAPTCPHCGEIAPGDVSPEQRKKQRKEALIGGVAVAVFIAVMIGSCSDSPEDVAKAKEAISKQEVACALDLQCIGDKGIFAAGTQCPALIEKQAKYSVKWTDGTLEAKFSRYRWEDKSNRLITFIGDKVQFQNGYGAWVPMTYACDMKYQDGKFTVVSVIASEGRL